MLQKKSIIVYLAGVLSLVLCALASIAIGSKNIDFGTVLQALFGGSASSFDMQVVQTRIPRTIFGLLAGAGLGVSGTLMQSITRNPIADPSILGVNTGASLFVVCGIAFFHISSSNEYILLAFTGALLTTFLVFGLASLGYGGATPIKLALSGAAASTALQSLVNTVMLPSTQVMDQFRFWQTGSISGATYQEILVILPYLLIGIVGSWLLAGSLNALALGDEAASALGVNTKRVRALGALCGVLLCASVTALAGPIGFVGLMVPHLMRLLLGADLRKILVMSAVYGAVLLLGADVLGRIVARPGELETGIVTAILGAPVFIAVVRKAKVSKW